MKRLLLPLLALFTAACATAPSTGGLRTTSGKPEAILLDTDGAVFWDDGAALAMILREPERFDLRAITVGFGNHWPLQGAEYVARILKAYGREDIPIYVGDPSGIRVQKPEKGVSRPGSAGQRAIWMGAFSRPKRVLTPESVDPAPGEATTTGILPRKRDAVTFLVEALRLAPEPMTFVALGPLTNLAQALRRDPSIARKIRRLLFMGGALRVPGNSTPKAELNFFLDPESAETVVGSSIPEKVMFPLDVSDPLIVNRSQYQEMVAAEGPFATLLKKDRQQKFEDPNYVLHAWDTSVVAYMMMPECFLPPEELRIRVVTGEGPSAGESRVSDDPAAPKVSVVMGVGTPDCYLSVLKGAPTPDSRQIAE